MVLLIILSIITSLLPPLALEQIVNHLTDQKEVSLLFALAYLGLIVLSDLFASAQNISITIFGQKLTHGMRSALVQKLNTITTGYLTSRDDRRPLPADRPALRRLYPQHWLGLHYLNRHALDLGHDPAFPEGLPGFPEAKPGRHRQGQPPYPRNSPGSLHDPYL